jgi:immune inhibitor A
MNRGIMIILMILIPALLLSVPMSPELEKRLREDGRFYDVVSIIKEAQSRGMDEPSPRPIQLRPGERVTLYAVAILVDFSDKVATTSSAHYDTLLSSLGTFPTGSVRDYYLENSYNNADVITTVAGWYRMPQTYAYYVNGYYGWGAYPQNAQRMAEDAVLAADPYVDFSQFDNDNDGYIDALFVVHAGPGAEITGDPNDIWSHAWNTVNVPYVDGVYAYGYSTEPEDGNIGVFAHEAGHNFLGLPDLYDYDYDSYGVGFWSLMSFGSWGDGGRRPVHLDAWCKIQSGFVTPIVPTVNQIGVQFPNVEFSSFVYKLWTHGAPMNQFFLVENRQSVGFDNYIPGSGMLIYHVDQSQSGNNNQWYPGHTTFGHYLVAVEQADGNWDLEKYINSGDTGDPYPGSSVNRFFNDGSTPDSKDYSFNSTLVGVENISNSSDTMTADIYVTFVGVDEESNIIDSRFRMDISPSIFRSSCTIDCTSEREISSLKLTIYGVDGRVVKSFLNMGSGDRIRWKGYNDLGKRVAPGIYIVKMTGIHEQTQKTVSDVQSVILLNR